MVGLLGMTWILEAFPEEHCIKVREIMGTAGINPEILRGSGFVCVWFYPSRCTTRSMRWKKVLYATDELTGLIGAAI